MVALIRLGLILYFWLGFSGSPIVQLVALVVLGCWIYCDLFFPDRYWLRVRRIRIRGKTYMMRIYLDQGWMINIFVRPDAERWLHNHPWKWARSIILWGWYEEERPLGSTRRLSEEIGGGFAVSYFTVLARSASRFASRCSEVVRVFDLGVFESTESL